MTRRLVAWAVVGEVYGRSQVDPSLFDPAGNSLDEGHSLLDAVMTPRRLKREQQAAAKTREDVP